MNASPCLKGAIYLAANGNREEGSIYRQLELPDSVDAHSHLFGSMPLGAAFEIAAAAISVEDGEKEISCVEYAGQERFNLYSVRK